MKPRPPEDEVHRHDRREGEHASAKHADWAEQLFLSVPKSERARVQLPTQFLFGRQRVDEYKRDRLERARELLRQKGVEAFEEQPILVVATPGFRVVQFIVVDGHHRVRVAGSHNFRSITASVVSVSQMARAQTAVSESEIRINLETEVMDTIDSFRRKGFEVSAQYLPYDGKLETAQDVHAALTSRQLR